MKPSGAADEIQEHNVFVPIHRLAELFSVIDGQLWSPADAAGLRARLADYLATNAISARATPDEAYVAAHHVN
ncbi:hypothetical protein [Sphingomonas abietis]|uniref:Uncharacterized protein n=1 Tax=Sphingomonas abietis TaxID=3012344 RepID=A0ABY7NM41_9SPHN|nr:hypothetical protein [Sphingomonas abietis]WBO21541.1 hypothetical protein PBT88_15335 [Sphingomonas abietis]